jgi:hypothetical protein
MLQQRSRRTRAALLGVAMLVGAGAPAGLAASPAAAASTSQHPSAAVKGAISARPVPGHASPAISSLTLAAIPDDQRVKGDFNGDGRSDIGVLYDYGSARTAFVVLLSTGSSFQAPQTWYDSGVGGWSWSASKPVAGDFNGDGKSDIAVLYDYGNARTGVVVLQSAGSSFQSPRTWYDSGAGNWNWSASKPVVGDFNGDGRSDIGVLYNLGYATVSFLVLPSAGYYFNAPQAWYVPDSGSWDWNSSKPVAGDFNGDGKSDIAVLYTLGSATTNFLVLLSTGSAFNAPQTWYAPGSGNWDLSASKPVAGDFNGDGRTDLAVLYNYGNATTAFFVLPSTGYSFTLQNWYAPGPGNWDWNWSKPVAGDFNGDGRSDLAVVYNYGNATTGFLTLTSNGSSFSNNGPWYLAYNFDWNATLPA